MHIPVGEGIKTKTLLYSHLILHQILGLKERVGKRREEGVGRGVQSSLPEILENEEFILVILHFLAEPVMVVQGLLNLY